MAPMATCNAQPRTTHQVSDVRTLGPWEWPMARLATGQAAAHSGAAVVSGPADVERCEVPLKCPPRTHQIAESRAFAFHDINSL